jgi:hypothetical protein
MHRGGDYIAKCNMYVYLELVVMKGVRHTNKIGEILCLRIRSTN